MDHVPNLQSWMIMVCSPWQYITKLLLDATDVSFNYW